VVTLAEGVSAMNAAFKSSAFATFSSIELGVLGVFDQSGDTGLIRPGCLVFMLLTGCL